MQYAIAKQKIMMVKIPITDHVCTKQIAYVIFSSL